MRPPVSARNVAVSRALDPLIIRVRGEYLEMPGMQLTIAQAARLWQLDAPVCEAVLNLLVDEGFLLKTSGGAFVLAERSNNKAR